MHTFLAILVAMLAISLACVGYVKRLVPRAPWALIVLLLWAPYFAWSRPRAPGTGVGDG